MKADGWVVTIGNQEPARGEFFTDYETAMKWARGWPLSGARVFKIVEVANFAGSKNADAGQSG